MEKLIIGVHCFEEESHARTEVLRKFANLVRERYHNLEITICSPQTENRIPRTGEFSLTIDIVSLLIGITTEGGTHNANVGQLDGFKDKGCDLILCTSLSASGTKAADAIEEFAKTNGYKPIWISPFIVDTPFLRQMANECSAQSIFDVCVHLGYLRQ